MTSKDQQQIEETFGSFVLVSSSDYQDDNDQTRTRFTVRKPKGTKLYNFFKMPNGVIR